MKTRLSVNAYRDNPKIALDFIDTYLVGSNTGTVQIELSRSCASFSQEEYERERRARVQEWINNFLVEAYPEGVDENDLEQILLDFETYLIELSLELVPPLSEEETQRIMNIRKPECQLCFEEEGSFGCVRPMSHGKKL